MGVGVGGVHRIRVIGYDNTVIVFIVDIRGREKLTLVKRERAIQPGVNGKKPIITDTSMGGGTQSLWHFLDTCAVYTTVCKLLRVLPWKRYLLDTA